MSKDWSFFGFANAFDKHVKEQLPWYDLASNAMGLIARHYIPKNGRVYDLGASTGNVGRVLAKTLAERETSLIAIDESPDMIQMYKGYGEPVQADICHYDYKRFDVAIAFLSFMFLGVPARRKLLERLRKEMREGGAIIIFDKIIPCGGYPATVLSRLTLESKMQQGVDPASIMRKEIALTGVQRPLYPNELGNDAVEVFRFGDFAGWIIEG